MEFRSLYPTVTALIGEANARQLDLDYDQFGKARGSETTDHLRACDLKWWCGRFLRGEAGSDLPFIEWGLLQIQQSVGRDALRRTFAQKAVNMAQFSEFLAEVSVAATCAVFGKLLELERPTGVGDKDADILAGFAGLPVHVEVTHRTDNWLWEGETTDVQVTDSNGDPIPGAYYRMGPMKWRPTLSRSEREVMEEQGLMRPDPNPAEDIPQPAHCAIRDRIAEKAAKFPDIGINIVALCNSGQGIEDLDVFNAVYGTEMVEFGPGNKQRFIVGPGGLFASERFKRVWAVLFVETGRDLSRAYERNSGIIPAEKGPNVLFTNGHSLQGEIPTLSQALCRAFHAHFYLQTETGIQRVE
jgi:hypothetical protein